MSKPHLLIIDDENSYLELLQEALLDSFDVKCAVNLDEAENIIQKNRRFDIALVDENIGNYKGSEWIKNKVGTSKAATSFVLYSGMATEDAILKGLECGADDFLAKPISLLTLNSKLQKLITYQEKIHSYEHEIDSQYRVINISMAQASKYGSCMLLTSLLNQCVTLERIKGEVFSFLNNMGLEGCIAFYPINESPEYYSSKNGFCSPVEIDVMKLLKVKPRLYRFGNRAIFNHTLVSILILNLEDGTTDTDIYIDAFASVIECIGARITFIKYQNSLVQVQGQIQQAVLGTQNIIAVSKHLQQGVLNEITQNIGMSFHVLDMNEEQEDYLTKLVQNALTKHAQDDTNFIEVTQLLDSALASVDELKDLNVEQSDNEVIEQDELF